LGSAARIAVSPDPAYALQVGDYVGSIPPQRARAKVGINPIGFCDPRVWARQDEVAYQRYLSELETFCIWLLDCGYDIEIFTAEISVDRYAIEELRERLAGRAGSGERATVSCLPRLDLDELLSQMSTFDFVITSKFHGVIFSHLLTKPVIALSYHRKIDDLMRTVGHERYCLPAGAFTAEDLTTAFKSLVQDKERLQKLFRRVSRSYSEAVGVEFDRLFNTAADGKLHHKQSSHPREILEMQGQRS